MDRIKGKTFDKDKLESSQVYELDYTDWVEPDLDVIYEQKREREDE